MKLLPESSRNLTQINNKTLDYGRNGDRAALNNSAFMNNSIGSNHSPISIKKEAIK